MQRTRRGSREHPARGTWIQVLWLLEDDREVWWYAKVLETELQNRRDFLAIATIHYIAYGEHGESQDRVDFLPGNVLRLHSNDSEPNENPLLEWRYPLDLPPHVKLVASLHDVAGSSEEESEWEGAPRSRAVRLQGTPHQAAPTDKNDVSEELRSLRESHANLASDVMRLRMRFELECDRGIGSGSGSYRSEEAAERVLRTLSKKLLLTLQKSPKPVMGASSRASSREKNDCCDFQAIDGVFRSYSKASAECTLHDFEAIARRFNVKNMDIDFQDLKFFPEYCYTQGPVLGSTQFCIAFSTLASFCDYMGLDSVPDRLEMVRRYGNSKKGGVLRLAGTYVFEERDDRPAAIFIGTSCGPGMTKPSESRIGEAAKVLLRSSRRWNLEDRRYDSPLRMTVRMPSSIEDPRQQSADRLQPYSLQYQAVHLLWRRDGDLSFRMWSKDVCDRHFVTGKLEAVVPTVTICGDSLCDEVSQLLSKDVLAHICTSRIAFT